MSEEDSIRTVIKDWARAVEAGDRAAILAHHAPDLLMFDFPATVRGLDAYDRTWDFFFKNPRGPISFVPRDIAVTAAEDIAFALCLVHCDGTSAGPLDFRLTTGLRKVGGEWVIVHEHHSVPTKEERFIDPDAGHLDTKDTPASKTEMLIRRPVAEVFEAFVDPNITAKFWFSKGSDRLEAGKAVRWEWEMFGISEQINVKTVDPNRRIVIEWPGYGSTNTVEWFFMQRPGNTTLVSITESGFVGDGDDLVKQVADSTGGFNLVLAGLKAYVEHNVILNLVADRFPEGPSHGT